MAAAVVPELAHQLSRTGSWAAYIPAVSLPHILACSNSEHQVQYHEVLGELTGAAMRHAALFFNVTSLLGLTVVQIIACASDAYYLWQGLTKR